MFKLIHTDVFRKGHCSESGACYQFFLRSSETNFRVDFCCQGCSRLFAPHAHQSWRKLEACLKQVDSTLQCNCGSPKGVTTTILRSSIVHSCGPPSQDCLVIFWAGEFPFQLLIGGSPRARPAQEQPTDPNPWQHALFCQLPAQGPDLADQIFPFWWNLHPHVLVNAKYIC